MKHKARGGGFLFLLWSRAGDVLGVLNCAADVPQSGSVLYCNFHQLIKGGEARGQFVLCVHMKLGQEARTASATSPKMRRGPVMFTSGDRTGPAHPGRRCQLLPELNNYLMWKTGRGSWDASLPLQQSQGGYGGSIWRPALTYQQQLWCKKTKQLLTLGCMGTLKR